MKSLGKILKDQRELLGLTLRQVEDSTSISNPYLSQLENDKIKKPSANVLYKLSSLYRIELEVLLIACGIVKETSKPSKSVLKQIDATSKLTPQEESQLLEYLIFLRSRKQLSTKKYPPFS